MDKALNYLSLARKAGRAELGEEPVAAAIRAQHAHLVLVASDASDHTWRRVKSLISGTEQQCLRFPYTKDEMGMAIGRTSLAVAAITDPALALSLTEALGQSEVYKDILAVLQQRVQKLRQRSSEAKAHQRNRRKGKTAAKKNG